MSEDQLDHDFFATNQGRRYRIRRATGQELERGLSAAVLVVDCSDGDFYRASFNCKDPAFEADDEQTCSELFWSWVKFMAKLQRGQTYHQGSERTVSGHC